MYIINLLFTLSRINIYLINKNHQNTYIIKCQSFSLKVY